MAITPRTLQALDRARSELSQVRVRVRQASKQAAIPGRPFGRLSETEAVKLAKRYSAALDEYEQVTLEIDALTASLQKRKSKLQEEIKDLKTAVVDNLEPGMKKVAQVRGGLLQWSVEQRSSPPGYKQILEEAQARMLEQLDQETAQLALQILQDAIEATKGVKLTFNNIRYVADMEEGANKTASRTTRAGLLDRLFQAMSRLKPMIARVKGVLGLARKRIDGDSAALLKNLTKMRAELA